MAKWLISKAHQYIPLVYTIVIQSAHLVLGHSPKYWMGEAGVTWVGKANEQARYDEQAPLKKGAEKDWLPNGQN